MEVVKFKDMDKTKQQIIVGKVSKMMHSTDIDFSVKEIHEETGLDYSDTMFVMGLVYDAMTAKGEVYDK